AAGGSTAGGSTARGRAAGRGAAGRAAPRRGATTTDGTRAAGGRRRRCPAGAARPRAAAARSAAGARAVTLVAPAAAPERGDHDADEDGPYEARMDHLVPVSSNPARSVAVMTCRPGVENCHSTESPWSERSAGRR